MELAQKTILITGASGGIGTSLSKILAQKGASLILTSPEKQKLEILKDDIEGNNHYIYEVDFTNREDLINFCENISSKHKAIDILINNAGIGIYQDLENIDPKDWFDSYDINIHAPFIITKMLLPNLIRSEKPVIINVGSVCGVDTEIFEGGTRVAYNSTKFALRGFSLTLSNEFKNTKLKSVLLTVPSVMTNFGPLSIEDRKRLQEGGKKYLSPDELASKIVNIIINDKLKREITF